MDKERKRRLKETKIKLRYYIEVACDVIIVIENFLAEKGCITFEKDLDKYNTALKDFIQRLRSVK